MIRRRRSLFLVVLILGGVWVFIVPLISEKNSAKRSDTIDALDHIHIDARGDVVLREKIKVRDQDSDDLGEVDYAGNAQSKVKNNEFVQNERIFRTAESRTWQQRLLDEKPLTRRPQVAKFGKSALNSSAPGHKGRMVRIDLESLTHEERKVYEKGWKTYFHNEYVNNMISPQRYLSDVRDPSCRSLEYSEENLLSASVVIVFHNEAWMTLLRTIHSVIDRSPENLLKEIILVDDASTFDHLDAQLSKYVSHLSIVRLLRLKLRSGSSFARDFGASVATGDVVVFLDAHCECTEGWLEPLLSHIKNNASNVAIPVLDVIDDSTFAYRAYDATHIRIGSFDWTLEYRWTEIPDHEKHRRTSDTDPIRNPVMYGGIFAISRSFLSHLNGFDQSLDFSGIGQNLEMSFKIWMCGGTLETIPCSHVGHHFHHVTGRSQPVSRIITRKNYAAVAVMWLDSFKELHFQKTGLHKLPPKTDSVAEVAVLRETLQCRSFEWYLRNVIPDLFAPAVALAYGKIRSRMILPSEDGQKSPICIVTVDNGSHKTLSVISCQSMENRNKLWSLSMMGEIRQGDHCLDFPGSSVLVYQCHGGKGNQEWTYREDKLIQQVGTKRCLTLQKTGKSLTMEDCVASDFQIWDWKQSSDNRVATTRSGQDMIKQELAVLDV